MRTIFDILQEAKDDNLHEFIQYIIDSGKEGELKTGKESIPRYLQGAKPIMDHFDFKDILDSLKGIYRRTFKQEPNLDNIEEFVEWGENWGKEEILKNLKFNNNNCIYIERAIVVPHFSNKDKLYMWFKKDYKGRLGECWAYKEGTAYPYDAENKPGEVIIFKGYILPNSVDWSETLARCLLYTNEYELTLWRGFDDEVQLTEIVTKKGNHKIFTGNLLMKI